MKNRFENNLAQAVPTLVSLIPFLSEAGKGHDFIYNKSVQRAAELIGWKHIAAMPKIVEIDNLPPGWIKCLPPRYLLKKNVFSKIKTTYLYAISIYRFLRKDVIQKSDFQIIFIESFFLLHLLALIIALFFTPRNSLSVWLLYRNDQPFFGLKGKICRVLNRTIKNLLRPNRFQLLSDSELLTEWFSVLFDQKVTIVPIPHTNISCHGSFPKQPGEIICWLAGQQYRKNFNINVVQRMAKMPALDTTGSIRLVVSESAHIVPNPQGIKIYFVKDVLSKSEYSKWLFSCDIVLLPYDSVSCSKRTSGVFVECIAVGKIPVVTKGTWMANELEKADLEELIVDWDNPDLLSWLLKVANDAVIKRKIAKMQKTYLKFHNEESFANTMKLMFQKHL